MLSRDLIENLLFSEVSQEIDTSFWYSFKIHFKIGDTRFVLRGEKNTETGGWYPNNVWHDWLTFDETCPYCRYKTVSCPYFSGYRNDLFRRLIEHPAIRLQWVFLDHI